MPVPSLLSFLSDQRAPALPNDDSEYLKRLEKRLERASYCMHRLRRRDPATGIMREIVAPCDEWRVCPICRKYRVKEFKGRVDRAAQAGEVHFVIVTDDRAKKLVRKYGSEYVFRLPQESGNVALFIATTDNIGERVTPTSVFDWDTLIWTPEDKNVTGELGLPPKKAKSETAITVRQMAYSIEGLTSEQLAQADRKAIAATRDLDPQDADELKEAILKRDKLYLQYAREFGAIIAYLKTVYTNVEIGSIRWKMTLTEAFRLVKEANLELPTGHKSRHDDYEPAYDDPVMESMSVYC